MILSGLIMLIHLFYMCDKLWHVDRGTTFIRIRRSLQMYREFGDFFLFVCQGTIYLCFIGKIFSWQKVCMCVCVLRSFRSAQKILHVTD